MLKSFFTTGLRNILKNKVYAAISLIGLGLCVTACIFLSYIIYTELIYDSFHVNSASIYRLTLDESISGRPGARHFPRASPPAGPTLKDAFEEIKSYVRLRYTDSDVFQYGDKRFYEYGSFYADSTFFDVFSFELLKGNKKTALRQPNSIVISQKIATKYFGDEDPIGKILRMNEDRDFQVTGVLAEVPVNSHLAFDILMPFHAFRVPFGYPVDLNSWTWASFNTYLLLEEGVNAKELEEKFLKFSQSNLPEVVSNRFALRLQPLSDIYFGDLKTEEAKSGSIAFVNGLIIVAAILLLLSALNFVNLNSTRLLIRSKESGIRKILGAQKGNFYWQFVTETLLLTTFSCAIGFILFALLDAQLQSYFNVSHSPADELLPFVAGAVIIFSIVLGLFSGAYPAFISSKIQVIRAVKGELKTGKSAIALRAAFILLQFVITSALLAGVFIVYQQLDFIRNKDLGYEKGNVLILDAPGEELTLKDHLIRTEISKLPWVVNVASSGTDMDGNTGSVPIFPEGNEFEEGYPMPIMSVRPGWFEVLNIKFAAGHGFTNKIPLDSGEIVINETAAKIFNWTPEEALEKNIRVDQIRPGRIVGVMSDFNYASLHSDISPLVMYLPRTHVDRIYIKFMHNNISQALNELEVVWKNVFPTSPFYYRFLDQSIQNHYQKETNFQKMLLSFSIMALIIACSGIYSFAAFMIKLKYKETAVRKVLGCTPMSLFVQLSRPFVLLVLGANILAIPLSFIFMNNWLQSFAFRTEINPLLYVAIVMLIVAIVLLTTAGPLVRMLKINPIKFLRED